VKTIKSLLPILVLLVLSFYTYHQNEGIFTSFLNTAIYLPPVLAVLAIGLTIHFNRSPVFFYVFLLLIVYFVLALDWLNTDLSYGLFSGLIPILLLVCTVLPERSILSPRAIPVFSILLIIVSLSIWQANLIPAWLSYFVLNNWLPARYFDWSLLSQTALAISVLVFLCMLVLNFVRTSTHMAAGLGVLLMLITLLHYGENIRSQIVFSSAALLMCLYAVVQESWRMAYLDELTELPARRALREKFQDLAGQYTIAMLDVDHFKKFNDTYGHDIGDSVLRMIAARLREVTGAGLPYRYGGEEFAVVFNGKDVGDAKAHLEDLRKDIADSYFVINRKDRRGGNKKSGKKKSGKQKNKSVQVTVSIGFADSNGKASTPWGVLKLADKALYRAKKKGRNRVCR
jgi:GGDEF domain-containing protein